MQLPDTIQCNRCRSFLSHPLDHCPVCNDQFYWLVKTRDIVDPEAKMAFLREMELMAGGHVTSEFLTHGGQLWLPHQFWSKDASGQALSAFPWIIGLEHHQHENPNDDWEKHQSREAQRLQQEAQRQEEPTEQPKPWDTIPNMPLPDFSDIEARKQQAQADAKNNVPQEPQPTTKKAPSKAPEKKAQKTKSKDKQPFMLSPAFKPTMVFLFFLFLSASYLVLRYHKNHMLPQVPETSQQDVQTDQGDSP